MNPDALFEDDYAEPERTPNHTLSDEDVESLDVEYSIRGPKDWVISGPLGEHGWGPGRKFGRIKEAEAWVREKYGDRVRWRIKEASKSTAGLATAEMKGGGRWAYLIKGDA